ncbi:unnamed protein product, partial [Ixodes pacificus]
YTQEKCENKLNDQKLEAFDGKAVFCCRVREVFPVVACSGAPESAFIRRFLDSRRHSACPNHDQPGENRLHVYGKDDELLRRRDGVLPLRLRPLLVLRSARGDIGANPPGRAQVSSDRDGADKAKLGTVKNHGKRPSSRLWICASSSMWISR